MGHVSEARGHPYREKDPTDGIARLPCRDQGAHHREDQADYPDECAAEIEGGSDCQFVDKASEEQPDRERHQAPRESPCGPFAHGPHSAALGVRFALRDRPDSDYRGAVALEVTLLGPPRVIERDGERVAFDTRKAIGAAGSPGARRAAPVARGALRAAVAGPRPGSRAGCAAPHALDLRTAVGEEWIDTAGDSIALQRGQGLELDVERFRELAADGAALESLSEAVALFSGDFLEGFSLRDSPEFDDWQMREADALAARAGSAPAAPGGAAGGPRRLRARAPPRPPLARGRSAARARAPRADPAVCLERRPRRRARAVPQVRSNAEPGARGRAARGDGGAVRAGERREPGASRPTLVATHAPGASPRERRRAASCRSSGGPRRWPRSSRLTPAPGPTVAWP